MILDRLWVKIKLVEVSRKFLIPKKTGKYTD